MFEVELVDHECIPHDVSDANTTLREFVFVKPTGTELVATGPSITVVTDGLDGRLRYVSQAGDLNEQGEYRLQVEVTFLDGTVLKSDIGTFTVEANLR